MGPEVERLYRSNTVSRNKCKVTQQQGGTEHSILSESQCTIPSTCKEMPSSEAIKNPPAANDSGPSRNPSEARRSSDGNGDASSSDKNEQDEQSGSRSRNAVATSNEDCGGSRRRGDDKPILLVDQKQSLNAEGERPTKMGGRAHEAPCEDNNSSNNGRTAARALTSNPHDAVSCGSRTGGGPDDGSGSGGGGGGDIGECWREEGGGGGSGTTGSSAAAMNWAVREGMRRVRSDAVERKMQWLTGVAAIGGFLFGYDTGVIRCVYRSSGY
jgi:hypothetical protein